MRVDFSACANFKGNNQKPLILAEGLGAFRPHISEIAEHAIKKGVDGVVLRSYSHPEGTDERWEEYKKQMEGWNGFSYLGKGVALYRSPANQKQVILMHGQGLMTSQGNIQVIFTDRRIGERGSAYEKDFDYLVGAARDSGDKVLITAARPYAEQWKASKLEMVDALEVHNGMDTNENNERALEVAQQIGKPGVFVSNSKTLKDIGSSYTALFGSLTDPKDADEVISKIHNGLSSTLEKGPQGLRGNSGRSKLVQLLAIAEVKITGNKN